MVATGHVALLPVAVGLDDGGGLAEDGAGVGADAEEDFLGGELPVVDEAGLPRATAWPGRERPAAKLDRLNAA